MAQCSDGSLAAHFLSPAECNQQTPLVITFTHTLFPSLSSLFAVLSLSLSHPLPLLPLIISYLPAPLDNGGQMNGLSNLA